MSVVGRYIYIINYLFHNLFEHRLTVLAYHKPKDSHHRFDCKEPDWGFTRFKTLRSLTYLRDGQSRPTIEDGQADVSVFVRVMKDPTGKLWLDPEQAEYNF